MKRGEKRDHWSLKCLAAKANISSGSVELVGELVGLLLYICEGFALCE